MNLLLSAYSCDPGRGSEQEVGWGWACSHTDAGNNVTVATQDRYLHRLTGAAADIYGENAPFFLGSGLGRAGRWLRRVAGGLGERLYYLAWQHLLAESLRKMEMPKPDLAQHVTYATCWSGSALRHFDVPYIWGPVGGGDDIPIRFWAGLGLRGVLEEAARIAVHWIAGLLPGVRATAREARLALAATPATAHVLRRLGAQRVEILSQAALSQQEFAGLGHRVGASGPVRLLLAGELVRRKGVHLALNALSRTAFDKTWHLDIIGDGRDRPFLETLTQRLGFADYVTFQGPLPRPELLSAMCRSDILLNFSLRDSASLVCVEAMAAELPVICLDLGGPGYLVPDAAGLKLDATSPDQVARDGAVAIDTLLGDPVRRRAMGRAGRQHVEANLTWPARHARLTALLHAAGLVS